METLSLILQLWQTLYIVSSQSEKLHWKGKETTVLYSPWHGKLEFLNSAFLTFVGTLLYVWLHILLCVTLVMSIILLKVAVDRVASAGPVAIESGNRRKKCSEGIDTISSGKHAL